MIESIQVLKKGGVPLFISNPEDDNSDYLKASFFSALGSFSDELQEGDLRSIELEKRSYLVKKGEEFSIIFGTNTINPKEHRGTLEDAFKVFENAAMNVDSSNPDLIVYKPAIEKFSKHIEDEKILEIQEDSVVKLSKLQNTLFSIVGYTPGVCNIGEVSRARRLILGMLGIILSLALFIVLLVIDAPQIYRLILLPINIGGFLGIVQYRHKFCVYNGLSNSFNMR